LKKKLEHIANIQSGMFAKTVSAGETVYLQARHFNEYGQLDTSLLLPDIINENILSKYFLINGDVLFAAKGNKNFASLYSELVTQAGEKQNAVASTTFFVIRLFENAKTIILPQYLTWFINHSQTILKSKAIGTSIVSISKLALQDLEIAIPDLQTQKAILQIAHLRNQEKALNIRIDNLREKQIQSQIINALK
jgi:restriction endonuclease S subunit